MQVILYISFALLTLAILLAWWRMARGPTVVDRILCFDAITVCVVGMIVLLSIRWDTSFYLELILVMTLLGFISGVAFVFYLNQTLDVHDPESMEDAAKKREDRNR